MVYKNDTGLPSVTQIIKPYIDTRWFTQAHADRGTEVHNWASCYLRSLPYPIDQRLKGYCDSASRWIDKYVDEILFVEQRMRDDDLGFCGQQDLGCTIKGDPDTMVMVDWKTAQATAKWWALQDAGYRVLAGWHDDQTKHRGLTIRLRADGKKALVTSHDNFESNWNVFQCHLTNFKFHYGG